MNMDKLQVIVEYAGDNLSAYINDLPIVAVGKNLNDIKRDITEAIQIYKDSCVELGVEPSALVTGDYELSFIIDATTFINYYSSIFTKAALSRITGINERQLWHYAAGLHKPRKRQLERIQRGVKTLTEELNSICLL